MGCRCEWSSNSSAGLLLGWVSLCIVALSHTKIKNTEKEEMQLIFASKGQVKKNDNCWVALLENVSDIGQPAM